MKQRLDYIDIAKGILILLTVYAHIFQSGYLHCVIYAFHMPAFFVISGILIAYTHPENRSFGKTFLGKLYAYGFPFLFIEFLGILTDIIRHGVTLKPWGYIGNTVAFDFNDGNLWFLVDLFLIEIFFILVRHFVHDERALLAIGLLLFLLSCFLPRENNYVNTLISSMRYSLYFSIGMVIKEMWKKRSKVLICFALIYVLIIAFIFGRQSNFMFSVEHLLFVIAALAGTYIIIEVSLSEITGKARWILTQCGKNTIIIYGTHHIIYSIFGKLMGITDYASTPLFIGAMIFVLTMICEIPVVYIINHWLPFLAGRPIKVPPTRKIWNK